MMEERQVCRWRGGRLGTYMLVDEQNRDVLAFSCEAVERGFDLGGLGFGVHDEEVFLRVGGWGYVLDCSSTSSM
jgi:hypothetical protein